MAAYLLYRISDTLTQYPNGDFLERESEQFLYRASQKRENLFSAGEQKQIEKAFDALQNGWSEGKI
jgi:hypothetical protein